MKPTFFYGECEVTVTYVMAEGSKYFPSCRNAYDQQKLVVLFFILKHCPKGHGLIPEGSASPGQPVAEVEQAPNTAPQLQK